MKYIVSLSMAAVMTAALPTWAQWSVLIPESTITAVTGRADAAVEEMAVDASGRILIVDEDEGGNDRLLRFDSNGTNGIVVTTEASIKAAIELVNGTSTQGNFSINGLGVAADGDIIMTN